MAPVEVITDQAACYLRVLEEVLPEAWHRIERYANNRIEADHAQLKARLRPMRGLKTDVGARTVIAGHAFMQNLRRVTTNSPLMLHRSYVSQRPSMSSRKQFDPGPASDSTERLRSDNATKPVQERVQMIKDVPRQVAPAHWKRARKTAIAGCQQRDTSSH